MLSCVTAEGFRPEPLGTECVHSACSLSVQNTSPTTGNGRSQGRDGSAFSKQLKKDTVPQDDSGMRGVLTLRQALAPGTLVPACEAGPGRSCCRGVCMPAPEIAYQVVLEPSLQRPHC